eukprot:NODE_403_length_2109_cov_24.556796_g324_i0.p1 GENE.NODE_403_length_2109_cov_24.556796_g324_i0~~NODE_403_length_2109_cov_24.556796_g324_i0.p1  ORF type:complete len:659 (-),score=118.06 NODE_403_length_2109_cov_24.556796_g324_i0:67-2043(-)
MERYSCLCLLLLFAAPACPWRVPVEYGPFYGAQYSHMNDNCIPMRTPPISSPDHYFASMKRCQAMCEGEPSCFAFTYTTPEAGADKETCCLKNGVSALLQGSPFTWGGLPQRAGTWIPPKYPTGANGSQDEVWQPEFHYVPYCALQPSWHDIAGAMYDANTKLWHVYQGCPNWGGWHHSYSSDLISWQGAGIAPYAVKEYAGEASPCSGFMCPDENGQMYAGFRQCPPTPTNGVPPELRRAINRNLTVFDETPIFLFPFYYNYLLPYDPPRPFIDHDGNWYFLLSTDYCNRTTRGNCVEGSAMRLYRNRQGLVRSDGWESLGIMYYQNITTPVTKQYSMHAEFVTAGYFSVGQDDYRLLTHNVPHVIYYRGKQRDGSQLEIDWSDPNCCGIFDWGGISYANGAYVFGPQVFTMARTMSAPHWNQVLMPGRRVLAGWTRDYQTGASLQALPRDITIDEKTGEVLQMFVPELKNARMTGAQTRGFGGRRCEVLAEFVVTDPKSAHNGFGISFYGGWANVSFSGINISKPWDQTPEQVIFTHTSDTKIMAEENFDRPRAVFTGPLGSAAEQAEHERVISGPWNMQAAPFMRDSSDPRRIRLHAIVDNNMIVWIVNNRTASTTYTEPPLSQSTDVGPFSTDNGVQIGSFEIFPLRKPDHVPL